LQNGSALGRRALQGRVRIVHGGIERICGDMLTQHRDDARVELAEHPVVCRGRQRRVKLTVQPGFFFDVVLDHCTAHARDQCFQAGNFLRR
jgi:hypothetical protein